MNNVTGKSSILKVVLIWAGVAIIIIAMKMSATILSSFLLAGVIGISVLPATRWLIRKGVSTWLALLITIGLIFLGVVALIAVYHANENEGRIVNEFSTNNLCT